MPEKKKRRKPVDKSLSKVLENAELPPLAGPNVMPDITGPGGRESLYRPEYDKMLIAHMATGLSFETFAGEVGVCRETLYSWAKANASFHNAKERGKAACQLFWEKVGLFYMVEGRRTEIEVDRLVEEEVEENGKIVKKKVLKRMKEWTKGTEKMNSNVYRLNMVNRFKWTNSGSEEADGAAASVNINLQVSEMCQELERKNREEEE